ncbi:deoxyribonuclease-2-alpha isoform X3 [Pleuronectes platessa]|uniref:deoxyribonuclease-2-alpha isoform X3 n=1 Tax=Pleuronectes platessa TaxID=8262 RepID=UPI00232A0C51|nr:deoxyribonuclease-2-alpha isoform X3 [Pleuronectes platessa]
MMRYKTVIRFLFSTGIFFQACESDVSCRNDDGVEVDWYILYKLPNMNDGGLSYLYMDESTNGWIRSKENINSNSGTLAHTLKPLLDFYDRKTAGFGYLLYNDQPPRLTASASFGHSKGLQLQYIHPYSFDHYISTTFPPELRCVARRTCYPKRKPWFRLMTLTSVKGQRFTSFAKYTRFWDDIYSGFIVNHLKQDLYVKSWGKMRRPLPSNCSIPHNVNNVYNVKKVQLPGTQTFSDTVDHSKWSVTADIRWTCIADMNREMSQMGRGGGAICINDAVIGDAFYSLIKESERCDRKRPRGP